MIATYTKLKSGDWGIRVEGAVSSGATVTVKKKDGTTRDEIAVRVLWTGTDNRTGLRISLCTIAKRGGNGGGSSRGEASRYPRTGCACGSRDGYPQESDCWTCRHDA